MVLGLGFLLIKSVVYQAADGTGYLSLLGINDWELPSSVKLQERLWCLPTGFPGQRKQLGSPVLHSKKRLCVSCQ